MPDIIKVLIILHDLLQSIIHYWIMDVFFLILQIFYEIQIKK